jgi:hypothetical protein
MPSPRLIRRITAWWLRRCNERRLSSIPGYRKIEAEIADRRRRHRPTRDLQERKRALLHDNMRGMA